MKRLSTILFFMCCTLVVFSQQNDIQKEYNKDGMVSFLKFKNEKTMKNVSEVSKLLRDSLKMKSGNIFELQSTEKNETGHAIRSYIQFYKGVKVEHGAYAVNSRNDKIYYIVGSYKDVEGVSVTPSLDEKSALKKALSYIKATKYRWEDKLEEENIKLVKNDKSASYVPDGELVIIKDFLKSNNIYRLAYKFDIYAELPLSHKIYYIDAANGDLLDTQELIMEINVNGTAQTRYSGTQNIVGDSYTGGFRLREIRNGVNIQTYNMNLGTSYGSASDFSDNDNNWTASEYNNINFDNAALDAHWASEKVYNYFLNTHGRNSYDNLGGALLSYVHANLVAMGYSNNINAFWDGQRMTYGDGGGSYGPIVSLDVVAHEIGHGVLQHSGTSGGLKYSGESGALNEGLSDIWGACVEAQAAPNKQKWLIGDDLGSPLRSMSNPNTYGDPDTYNGTNWRNPNDLNNDHGGVHHNSGVLNYWFYLLTEGGSGSNDINHAFNVAGIGINDAQSIVYKTLNEFLSNNFDANFSLMRTFTIQAAIDLFGSGSCQERSVTSAWYAVGVGNDYQANLLIQGPSIFCTSQTYTVPNLPTGAAVIWTASPSNVVSISTTNNVGTLTKINDGRFNLVATINSSCGSQNITKNSITAGLPEYSVDEQSPISGETEPIVGEWYHYSMTAYRDATSYEWDYAEGDNPTIWAPSGVPNSADVMFNVPGEYRLVINVTTPCGSRWLWLQSLVVNATDDDYMNYSYSFFPNPAGDELTVSYEKDKDNQKEKLKVTPSIAKQFKAELFDDKGKLVRHATNNKGQESIALNTRDCPNGNYFLHITEGKLTTKKQIIIKH